MGVYPNQWESSSSHFHTHTFWTSTNRTSLESSLPCLKLGEVSLLWYHLQLLLFSHSVISNSFATPWTIGSRLLCPWDFSGKNTKVDCHFLLQGIFLTQRSNPRLLGSCYGRQILYHWVNRESRTHIFISWPSFLKGYQTAKRCSHTHWIHHHQNMHRSFCFLGSPRPSHIKTEEISEFVGKMNGLGSKNKRHNNHSSVIKPKGSAPAS